MYQFSKKIASAAAVSLLLAGAAGAQGNGVGASVSGEASAGSNAGGVGAEASGGVSAEASGKASSNGNGNGNAGGGAAASGSASAGGKGEANFGHIISAIRTGGAEVDAMTSVSSISVVDVESETRGENAVALENALGDREAEIADLQSSIKANAELAAALEAEGVDVDTVVAVETAADGSLTVYTR